MPQPPASAKPPLSFTVTAVGQSLVKEDVLASGDADFHDIVARLRSSDFCFTGYEGTIRGGHGGWPMKSTFLHVSAPLVLDSVRTMGFNLLSLSNNHAFDLGPGGVLSTLEEVEKRGFTFAGIGADRAAATRAGVRRSGCGTVALVAMDAGPQGEHVYASDASERMPARPGSNRLRVHKTLTVPDDDFARIRTISEKLGHEQKKSADAEVGYQQTPGLGFDFYGVRLQPGPDYEETRWADHGDAERNLASITAARHGADCVIAYVHHHHWEPRWEQVPAWFRRFARQCVDAGASMVVSHGVPMLQGIEIYRGAPLFFGLGNFIFHTFQPAKYVDERIWQSVVAKCYFSDGRCNRIDLTPIVIGGERALTKQNFASRRVPHIARGAYGERILHRLGGMSAALGTTIEIADGMGCVRISG